MNFDFNELKAVLSGWPSKKICLESNNSLYQRLSQVLSKAQAQGCLTQCQDLLPLIRQAMLRQKANLNIDVSLQVPCVSGWPEKSLWQKFGFYCEVFGEAYYKVSPVTWFPEWSDTGTDASILDDVYAEKECCPDISVPIDPCVRDASGFDHYSSEGQREAVRGAFFAPNGSTLVVNLPTGSGKSLVGYLPSLLGKAEGNFTLFVVPTIALAMDQAQQLREIYTSTKSSHINTPLAWHSGISAEDKELVKQNIRNGLQPVLFTSPEAVCGSLRWALYESARNGYLKYFVVDEAHLVSQWGVEFRPDFQAMSGVWRGLLKENGQQFKTFLMTATLAEETLDTLKILFSSSSRPFQIVSAVHLRPEPRYWHHKTKNFSEKKEQVLEAVCMGPRPFILYVTEPKEAERWSGYLKAAGYQRIGCFHGKTNNAKREDLIKDWKANKLDIMVATSAFGVGMDKSDVRMILHATVPENLDRFYQEVGRGGRDGKASLSLLIYTQMDLEKARRIAYPTVISEALGKPRWDAMVQSQEYLNSENEHFKLNLSTVPPNLNQQSDYNRAWNMRTLLLMVRAGAVQMDSEVPPKASDQEERELSELELQGYFDSVAIRYLGHNHSTQEFWDTIVSETRDKTAKASQKNYDLLRRILEDGAEVGDSLSQLYTINNGHINVPVSCSCGGCSHCRKEGRKKIPFFAPPVLPIQQISSQLVEQWEELFTIFSKSPIVLTYSRSEEETFPSVITGLIGTLIKRFGVREIVASSPSYFDNNQEFLRLYKNTQDRFLIHRNLADDFIGEYEMPVPRVTILCPWSKDPIPDQVLNILKDFHIIISPDDVYDTYHPLRRYCDVATNTFSLKEFRERVY